MHVVDIFDGVKINETAAILADFRNTAIFLRSKQFEGKTDKKDPWYGTEYSIESYNDTLKELMREPKGVISVGFPPKNTLLPKDLTVLPKSEEDSKEPKLVKEWKGDSELWF